MRLPHDIGELERIVHEVRARLLIIDPIVAAIDTAFDAHKDQHVRSVLARLVALAEDADCAIALVGHLNKTPSRDAYIRIGGSVAFYNASRSVVLVTEDAEEPEALRLITQSKANYSRLRPVERHRIEEIVLPGTLDPETGEPITTSRMVFVEVADDVDAADVLAPRVSADAPKELSAVGFLVRELWGGDWYESVQVKLAASAEDISERTLQRAKRDLGVEDKREGFPAISYWRLPQSRQGTPEKLGATVEGARLSEKDENEPPVAPSVQGGTTDGATEAILGDEGYDVALADAAQAGHLTAAEFEQTLAVHRLVEERRS